MQNTGSHILVLNHDHDDCRGKMMRRQPTLIPMSESDVQEVRDMVTQQKADAAAMAKWEQDQKKTEQPPSVPTAADKQKERARRLGL
ncbi:uncharacterized protein SCHCODRAFT_02632652 [Schizophyllum commune H4-8]|uniref:uncharacterized protein n=1 Tax=Schizophyllum commune (strain H4-8 / FGSC 9210) TaxID=578458 RepID=UPI00215FADA6|nr:uncharacterized protein SCHCODRAFT_02632652 [Schizophyllum commune H4-8]KAI5890704.1 hypothetical protein SCHCODRAFT_02632652 [Schizophyllum commune H4-8]